MKQTRLPDKIFLYLSLNEKDVNFKEYNTNTNQIADTLFDVGTEVGETMIDVAEKVEDTIEDVEISPNQILNLDD